MSTPTKAKNVAADLEGKSPRHFRWSQPFEDTLLELLVRESRKGNRPDCAFTSTAFRNVVMDFNQIHGTAIAKKHILSRIKTMKSHFVAFHGAFNSLSGFSWNEQTKMFDAEDFLWDQRIKENPKLAKFRYRACHNWDKLCELYGDNRAKGDEARGTKEKAKSLKRSIEFEDLEIDTAPMSTSPYPGHAASSFGDCDLSKFVADETTPEDASNHNSCGSSKYKPKKKVTWVSVMEDGYKTMATSIHELSVAVKGSADKVAGSRFDVDANSKILLALSSLGLEENYKVRCLLYLSANPSKAALIVAATDDLRAKLLKEIIDSAGDWK